MKKRYVCLLVSLVAVLLAGCGAKNAETTGDKSTQENVVASSAEVAESSENKSYAIGAGPDYVVAAHKDSVSYWSEEDEEMELAQSAMASELIILSPGYEKLKEAIAQRNAEAREGMEKAIASTYDFMEESEDFSYAYFPWESSTDMQVTRSDEQLFSYVENYYDYMGGAHGFYYSRGFNYEPATGRELKLTDLVTDLSKLQELVVAQIKEEWDYGDLYDEWEDTVAVAFEDSDTLNFLAGPDTISIWFDTYELAPYVCGEIQTILAMEDCEGLFNEAYFHAENAEVEPGKAVQGTELFQNVIQPLSEQICAISYNDVKALLDKAGYTYEAGMPGAEIDGAFELTDPENGATVWIYFWPMDVEEYEDYENIEKYFLGYMRYELDETMSVWIGREDYESITEYVVIDENYEQRYFETVEEMARYLFY